eukprot:Blabericola_migrator_1__3990@NODE_220_length_11204_cov_64_408458_g187_i0_p3_GENE_NODE_220_length_11204_cov_64_408458_g187_i0NODE_220_length_11204_cov_64_408458_g187_i0_p3_ORF_typecomplete_len977_score218_83AAA_12/PF13087_6/5_7e02AAA_12/PF13087_6/5_1e53AAA_11/PF13086_6/6_6e47AAA_30/PF13604_6/3_5e03AAA_30/PF13604_6/7e18AAA_19/PF13245_6/1_4e02AAA_19/PF13245_6/2e05AAA_19/PF13245_6/8_3e06Viral_helicase1/PF01443_18/15Viral_helicase1/PF01443_18/1_7e11ResIII/PF04851_15/2_2e02ResIII/PF04851_15/9_9e05ResI
MPIIERAFEAGSQQVSLHELTQILIAWDFHSDIVDDRSSNVDHERILLHRALAQAQNMTPDDIRNELILEKLPANFSSDDDYINRFLPLMLLEVKQGIHRAKELEMTATCGECVSMEGAEPMTHGKKRQDATFILHLSRAPVTNTMMGQGDLVLLYCDGLSSENDDPEHPILLENFEKVMRNRFRLAQGETEDLVREETVDETGKPALDADGNAVKAPDPLKDNPHHLLGIVEETRRGGLSVRVLIRAPIVTREQLLKESDGTGTAEDPVEEQKNRDKTEMVVEYMLRRERRRMEKMAEFIANRNSQWYLAKVMNLTTVYREFQSLMSFPNLPLRDFLMLKTQGDGGAKNIHDRAKRRRQQEQEEDKFLITDELQKTLSALYNASQLEALQDCLKARGITCIQGPPGTGKTTTIVGVLSVILNARTRDEQVLDQQAYEEIMEEVGQVKKTKAELQQATVVAMPWLFQRDYQPWYDNQVCRLEDLEDPTPLVNAIKSHEYIDLTKGRGQTVPKRVLVCAPSNAAIDEILRRLTAPPERKGGIFDSEGRRFNPQVLRCGPNAHPDLRKWTLNQRVEDRIQGSATSNPQSKELIQLKLLEEAQVVCATLSVAGSKELTIFSGGFDTVVVDEASQGVELSTLIPLKLNCKRLVLVGDPEQLPATVFSKVAMDLGYDQSLFQRLYRANQKINMLSVQYRMHPKISLFPRETFYTGRLLDYEKMEEVAKPVIPYYMIPMFKPLVFFSLDSKETSQNASKVNEDEADLIIQILDILRLLFNSIDEKHAKNWQSKVAVISPYAEQVKICSKKIKALFRVAPNEPCPIDVNTVDGFQGREKDIVLFSAVRAQDRATKKGKKASVGFLADKRRMNVALTRARVNMWVVGNGPYLSGNELWGKFWTHANSNDAVFNVNFNQFPKESFFRHWLVSYFERQPAAKTLMEEHAPDFVLRLQQDVQLLREADEKARLDAEKAERDAAAALY